VTIDQPVSEHQPVIDWAEDYDLFDPQFVVDPYSIWDDLRDRCPVAHTDRWGGSWMPTRYEDISAVAHDTTHFSSRNVGVTGLAGNNPITAPPITSDPPFHTDARRILLPAFSPKAVERLTPITRGIADELIDDLLARTAARGDNRTDAAADFAQHLPVLVIGAMLGVPREDEARFTDWAVRVLQVGPTNREVGRTATREVLDYFREQVALRREGRQEDTGDLISHLLASELGGAPLDEKHILGTCFLLLLAGIDTTWSSIGAALWHLSTHAEDRRRLVGDPTLIPTAVEEFLRAYAPVTMAREVVAETTVGDRTVCPGERVLLAFPSGNRDPEMFEHPDEVDIERQHNRHFAFGIGIHRCLGSNLARMELRVALEAWLERIPEFELLEGAEVEWNGGQVRGPRALPLVLGSPPA
jgi:cytochrome P450